VQPSTAGERRTTNEMSVMEIILVEFSAEDAHLSKLQRGTF
jgi:hypothetical protein